MMHLECFGCQVHPELAKHYIGISHLSQAECTAYLVNLILTSSDQEEVVYSCFRVMNLLGPSGYPVSLIPGQGYMVMLEEIMGEDPHRMRDFLYQAYNGWRNATRADASSDFLGAMTATTAYIYFQLTELGNEWD